MKWFVLVVLALLVGSVACENYKGLFQPGYAQCEWEKSECRSDKDCCSGWCPNHECVLRP